jgi:gamma-glutamyl-gamma-aminobutyrate hydrolase PuuD
LELSRIKIFKKKNIGVFFGICRGHQLGAIADGHSLYQDLSADRVADTNHHVNLNGQNSTEHQTWHHIILNNSLLSRFLNQKLKLQVNGLHHQAVRVNPVADSIPIAFSDDEGIVEALQSKNKKSISVQFHPEFPEDISMNSSFSKNGFQIIKGILAYARMLRMQSKPLVGSCSELF